PPRKPSDSSMSHSATTTTFGLLEMLLRSSRPFPPVPTDASRSDSFAPYTRDQLAAVSTDAAPRPERVRNCLRERVERRIASVREGEWREAEATIPNVPVSNSGFNKFD